MGRAPTWCGSAGFLILGVFGLVVSGCGDDPPPPMENRCGWPRHCQPPASETLPMILEWATVDLGKGHIDPQDHQRIAQNVPRCLNPGLTNHLGQHVCLLVEPEPCEELARIRARADGARTAPDDKSARDEWRACADELDNFPTGRAP